MLMIRKKSKLVRVDPEIWDKVSKAFPNVTDAERSKFLFNTHPLMRIDEIYQGLDKYLENGRYKKKK